MGRISRRFVDRTRVRTDSIELCYEYPYQWSDTGGKIKHWCFVLPVDASTTRVFFLFYFESLKIPLTPFRIPRRLMTLALRLSNRLPDPAPPPAGRLRGRGRAARSRGSPASAGPRPEPRGRALPAADAPQVGGVPGSRPGAPDASARQRCRRRVEPRSRALDARSRSRRGSSPGAPAGSGLLGRRDGLVPGDPGSARDRAAGGGRAPDPGHAGRHASGTSRSPERRTEPGASTPRRRGASSSRRWATSRSACWACPPDDPLAGTARRWLHAQTGGVLAIPTWGKLWLALLDLYDYRGINPCPPELLLLPRCAARPPPALLLPHAPHLPRHELPVRPAGARVAGADHGGALPGALRAAARARRLRAPTAASCRRPTSASVPAGSRAGSRISWRSTSGSRPRALRRRALERGFARILYEQRQTGYQALSPGQRAPELPGDLGPRPRASRPRREPRRGRGLALGGPGSGNPVRRRALARLGHRLRGPGAPGHACIGPGAARPPCAAPTAFLESTQLTDELPDPRAADRDPIQGGWCFSDGAHRWPVSDCTAEALVTLLRIHDVPGLIAPGGAGFRPSGSARPCSSSWLGRIPTAASGRTSAAGAQSLLEALNPSEMFRDCMTERSYVECTGSAIAALARFRRTDPGALGDRLGLAIERGVRFLRAAQRPDGACAGFWGINFTYAAFHAVRGLRAAGSTPGTPGSPAPPIGSAGSSARTAAGGSTTPGASRGATSSTRTSQVVMTAWALLALMDVLEPGAVARPARRGLAHRRAAPRRLLAAAGRQRGLLRLRDAGLPAVCELLPGLGPGASRRDRRGRSPPVGRVARVALADDRLA